LQDLARYFRHAAGCSSCSGPNQQVKMIVEQAVAVERKRLSLLEVAESLQERCEIAGLAEHILSIVATIDHVVNQAVFNRSQGARHVKSATVWPARVNKTF